MIVAKLKDVVGEEMVKTITEGLDKLSTAEIKELYFDLSSLSKSLFKQNKMAERNALCEPIRKVYSLVDWGFSVGEKVIDCTAKREFSVAVIKEYYEDENTFCIKKETGGEFIVHGFMLKPYTEPPKEPKETEQVQANDYISNQLSFLFL